MESKAEDIVEDIRQRCALCKTMDCCPEHCCNWDTCRCQDCEYCRTNSHTDTVTHHPELAHGQGQNDPEILIKSTGAEQRVRVGTAKKKDQFVNKWAQDYDSDEQDKDELLHEQYRTSDGALIKNYEISTGEKQQIIPPEDEGKLNYAGGVRGIRALRKQRGNLPDVDSSQQQYNQQYNNSGTNNYLVHQKDEESKT